VSATILAATCPSPHRCKNLPTLTFADSDQVKVGDLVLAVGNPFAFTDTVTMGIVSALGRSADVGDDNGGKPSSDYQDFIQTDASINPGNSGGALVDTEGRLIGINTAIYSRSGGNMGIGFAVPSNLARNVIDSLLKFGKVNRGFLGTVVQELTPDLAEQFKVPDDQQGALIAEVSLEAQRTKPACKTAILLPPSMARRSSIRTPSASLSRHEPRRQVTVTYLRDGQSKTADVTLGGQESAGEVADNSQADEHPNVLDGVTVDNLDDASRSQLKVPSEIKGVIVTDVSADSVG